MCVIYKSRDVYIISKDWNEYKSSGNINHGGRRLVIVLIIRLLRIVCVTLKTSQVTERVTRWACVCYFALDPDIITVSHHSFDSKWQRWLEAIIWPPEDPDHFFTDASRAKMMTLMNLCNVPRMLRAILMLLLGCHCIELHDSSGRLCSINDRVRSPCMFDMLRVSGCHVCVFTELNVPMLYTTGCH